jgi:hypothetical protein
LDFFEQRQAGRFELCGRDRLHARLQKMSTLYGHFESAHEASIEKQPITSLV